MREVFQYYTMGRPIRPVLCIFGSVCPPEGLSTPQVWTWRGCLGCLALQPTLKSLEKALRKVCIHFLNLPVASPSLLSPISGRDPLLYVGKKVDIAAVASVLKGYFRELSTPLFPTDKYKSFISCTREPILPVLVWVCLHLHLLLSPSLLLLSHRPLPFLGHNELAGRAEAVKDTLNQVDPCVVHVMRLLFRFLYK